MHTDEYGSFRLVQPHALLGRIWLFTFVVLLTLIGFLFLPWQQTVKGTGTLAAYDPSERLQSVSAPITGIITQFYVEENANVAKGDKLFSMRDLDPDLSKRMRTMVQSLREQLKNIAAKQEALRANRQNAMRERNITRELYAKRQSQANDALAAFRFKLDAVTQTVAMRQAAFDRVQALYSSGIESRRRLDQEKTALTAARAEREQLELEQQIQRRTLQILHQELTRYDTEMQSRIRTLENGIRDAENRYSALERDLQRQLSDMARYSTANVTAEKTGSVVRIFAQDKSRLIRQGEAVLQFSPRVRRRALQLKVSDFNMPLIQEGLQVRILFYGWPTLHISGWPAIRFGTFGGTIEKIDPVAYEPGVYYAYVFEDPQHPWPSDAILRLGTQATVWVALETVPMWYQLWRQMNGMPPRMLQPKSESL